MERFVDVVFDRSYYAVLVCFCRVTGVIETLLFGDVEMAKSIA